jgi:hypothetical protein
VAAEYGEEAMCKQKKQQGRGRLRQRTMSTKNTPAHFDAGSKQLILFPGVLKQRHFESQLQNKPATNYPIRMMANLQLLK